MDSVKLIFVPKTRTQAFIGDYLGHQTESDSNCMHWSLHARGITHTQGS